MLRLRDASDSLAFLMRPTAAGMRFFPNGANYMLTFFVLDLLFQDENQNSASGQTF